MDLFKDTVFDYQTHKDNFIDYTEVVIYPSGKIEYAVPSHTEKLIEIYLKEFNISREELSKLIPLFDSPMEWIINKTGIITVHTKYIYSAKTVTKEQQEVLDKLVEYELIPKDYKHSRLVINEYGNLVVER